MKHILLLVLFIYSEAFANTKNSPTIQADAISKLSSYQDGPNCFGTSLYAINYKNTLTYTHIAELNYYLKYHCAETTFKKSNLQTGMLLTAAGRGEPAVHSAIVLSQNSIIEKNSLYGTKHAPFEGDPQPGKILIHNIATSIFFGKILKGQSNDLEAHAYKCANANDVNTVTNEFNQQPDMRKILRFELAIQQILQIKNRKQIEDRLNRDLVQLYNDQNIAETAEMKTTNLQYEEYKLGKLESLAYQWTLLNCSDAYEKYEECYAPEVQTSITTSEALYQKIYNYRSKIKSATP